MSDPVRERQLVSRLSAWQPMRCNVISPTLIGRREGDDNNENQDDE